MWVWSGLLRRTGRGLWRSAAAFYEHQGFDLAAALAFWALLNFIPFVIIFAGLFGVLMDLIGGADRSALVAEVMAGLREFLPRVDDSVARYLEALIGKGEAISLAGLPLFLLTSSAFYSTLENAVARIFHPDRSRSIARSKLVTLSFLTSLLVALVALGLAWLALVRLGGVRGAITAKVVSSPMASMAVGVLLCTLIFVVTVRSFAVDRIPYRLLLLGGLAFGLLWLAARLLFSVYLETIAPYDVVYGSFATLAVILIWAYYTGVIYLFAAEWVQLWRSSPPPPQKSANRSTNSPAST
jgi:membrane protein